MRLRPRAPFSLELVGRLLRRSRHNPVDRFTVERDGSTVWSRVLLLDGEPHRLLAEQRGAVVTVTARATAADMVRLAAATRRLLGVDEGEAARGLVERLAASDRPLLAEAALRAAALRPPRYASVFEALCNAICCQQISLDAGLAVYGRLATATGATVLDEAGAFHPSPPRSEVVADMSVDALKGLGLSTAKARWLREAARLDAEGAFATLDRLSDEEARAWLLALDGVGPWTADYVLLRGLARLDVFPRGDVGAANRLGPLLGEAVDPRRAPELVARFGPSQGLLYFIILVDELG